MKISLKFIFSFAGIVVIFLLSFGNGGKQNKSDRIDINKIVKLKFNPNEAIEYPFDSIVKSVKLIDLQGVNNPKITMLSNIMRTDSYIIICDLFCYLVFDLDGKYIRKVGDFGNATNSIDAPGFYYVNNESLYSFFNNKWIKYSLDGSLLKKGTLGYSVFPKSFVPLNDSTWLFYQCHSSDKIKLRLWTTDQNFRIKKEFLTFYPSYPTGGAGFMKFIFETKNGIYITDRAIDTIFRFTGLKTEPAFIFDFGGFKYRRTLEMKDLEFNEVATLFTLVSNNNVLRKVEMNNKTYFIYFNMKTNVTKTIKRIINGPDLVNDWTLEGSDKNNRFYWVTKLGSVPKIDESSIKYGYAGLIRERLKPDSEANPFLLVTELK